MSLFNDKNANIGKELYESLIANEQECPEWLEQRYAHGYGSGGGRGGGRGRGRGGRFGAKDFRKEGRGSGPTGGRGGGASVPYSVPTTKPTVPLPYSSSASRNTQNDNSEW